MPVLLRQFITTNPPRSHQKVLLVRETHTQNGLNSIQIKDLFHKLPSCCICHVRGRGFEAGEEGLQLRNACKIGSSEELNRDLDGWGRFGGLLSGIYRILYIYDM